jgi:hypothetical protein
MSLQIAANAYDFPHDGNLTSGNTALIVIDMQVDFCGVGGHDDRLGNGPGYDARAD